MKRPLAPWPALLALAVLPFAHSLAKADSHPIVPGFERFYSGGKGDTAQGGQLLLGELNCVSCHQSNSVAKKPAPVLDAVGTRVKIGAMRKFLFDPAAAKPGTTMPNLFAGDSDKAAKVEALTHFLASTGSVRQERPDLKGIILGKDLYQKVGCVACHGPRDLSAKELPAPPSAVPLGNLKGKYSISSLAAFLENPHTVRPGGRMPQLVNAKEAKELANYLLQGLRVDLPLAKGTATFAYYEGQWDKLPEFDKLKPIITGSIGAFDLGIARRGNDYAIKFDGFFKIDQPGSYRFTTSSDDGSNLYVDGKKVVDNDGEHATKSASGNVKLTKGVHKVTVAFFQMGGGAELDVTVEGPGLSYQLLGPMVAATESGLDKKPDPPKPNTDDAITLDPGLVAKGKALFAAVGCANCHQMNIDKKLITPTLAAPALSALKPASGCLAESPKSVPHYSLGVAQKSALAAAITTPPVPATDPKAVIAKTMVTFNCYACHARDKIGGPLEELNPRRWTGWGRNSISITSNRLLIKAFTTGLTCIRGCPASAWQTLAPWSGRSPRWTGSPRSRRSHSTPPMRR